MNKCNWNNPGSNTYKGTYKDALEYYKFNDEVKVELLNKISNHKYDDLAIITKNSILGKSEYVDLRDMHFGKNLVCNQPDRSGWVNNHQEVGLIYCVKENCVVIPTVCNNISLVTKVKIIKTLSSTSWPDSTYIGYSAQAAIIDTPELPELSTKIVEKQSFTALSQQIPFFAIQQQLSTIYYIPTIPEPSTWVLMILGVLIGYYKFNSKTKRISSMGNR